MQMQIQLEVLLATEAVEEGEVGGETLVEVVRYILLQNPNNLLPSIFVRAN